MEPPPRSLPDGADFAPGDAIAGRYHVVRLLARGGMGVVYACDDAVLGRRVAVKLMRRDVAARGATRERFLGEARAAAQLESPHVAQLYDCGALPTGEPFMVLEFLDGEDLFSILNEQGSLPPETVIRYLLQICEGLREVHAKGIVHRDIKPENLVVVQTPDGTEIVKIVDFGISQRLGAGPHRSGDGSTESVGSPHYMSPEQIETPAAVDVRTDIWALGVTLFELLTGDRPFDGPTTDHVCVCVLGAEVPRVSAVCPAAGPELDAIVARCLERDPDRRFASVDALMAALTHVYALLADGRPPLPSGVVGMDGEAEGPVTLPVPLVTRRAAPAPRPACA